MYTDKFCKWQETLQLKPEKIWGPAGNRIQDPLKSGLYLVNQERRAVTGLDIHVHLELEVNMLAILFGNLLLCPQQ